MEFLFCFLYKKLYHCQLRIKNPLRVKTHLKINMYIKLEDYYYYLIFITREGDFNPKYF